MQIILRCIVTNQTNAAIPGAAMSCAGLTFTKRSATVFEARVTTPQDSQAVSITGLTASAPAFQPMVKDTMASVDAICRVYFKLLP